MSRATTRTYYDGIASAAISFVGNASRNGTCREGIYVMHDRLLLVSNYCSGIIGDSFMYEDGTNSTKYFTTLSTPTKPSLHYHVWTAHTRFPKTETSNVSTASKGEMPIYSSVLGSGRGKIDVVFDDS